MTVTLPFLPLDQVNGVDVDFYIVMLKDERGRPYSVELSGEVINYRPGIIRNIVSGEWRNVDRIYCGNPFLRSFDDVTEDIAFEIWGELDDPNRIPAHLIDFLQAHVPEAIHGVAE